jgi:hypothetical protein
MQPSLISTDAQEDNSELYPACVITRRMTKHQSSKVSKPIDTSSDSSLLNNLPLPTHITYADFVTAQQHDEEIKNIKDRLISQDSLDETLSQYYLQNNLLFRQKSAYGSKGVQKGHIIVGS